MAEEVVQSKRRGPVPAKSGGAADPASLETALEKLDFILAEMEAADLPLEDLIGRYEQGVELVKFCRERLESAEQRIQTVTKQLDGTLNLEDSGVNST